MKNKNAIIPEILKDCDLKIRKDFAWGVNIHDSRYVTYPERNIEEMLLLSKRMGSRLLRIGMDKFEVMDKMVALSNAYEMDLMVCSYAGIRDSEENYNAENVYKIFNEAANRYNGKNGHGYVKYFQIDNEIDNYLLHESDVNYKKVVGNGSEPGQYEESMLIRTAQRFKNAIKGVKNADTDAKVVINFCWEHYGMLEYMYRNGVEWDITGYDWYGDMALAYEASGLAPFAAADVAHEKWGKDIIICETNHFSPTAIDEENPESWNSLYKIMKEAYKKNFVKGCTFYELLDEACFENDKYEREAHFGLIRADKHGNIGEPKAVYKLFCEVLGGKNIQPIEWEKVKAEYNFE